MSDPAPNGNGVSAPYAKVLTVALVLLSIFGAIAGLTELRLRGIESSLQAHKEVTNNDSAGLREWIEARYRDNRDELLRLDARLATLIEREQIRNNALERDMGSVFRSIDDTDKVRADVLRRIERLEDHHKGHSHE